MGNTYIPDRKDIIYVSFDPHAGTETGKRRPCLVMSVKDLNRKLRRVLVCPITRTPPRTLTHVAIPQSQKLVEGTILVDQLRSVDYVRRKATRITRLKDNEVYAQVVHLIQEMISD